MERKVPTMEISISAARADIVRYYEDRGYSHAHSEAYVPHDADQVMRIYNIIQKENVFADNLRRTDHFVCTDHIGTALRSHLNAGLGFGMTKFL